MIAWLPSGRTFFASSGEAVPALPLGRRGGSIVRGLGWFTVWSEGLPSAMASLVWHQVLFLLFLSSPPSGALSLRQQKAEAVLLRMSGSIFAGWWVRTRVQRGKKTAPGEMPQ